MTIRTYANMMARAGRTKGSLIVLRAWLALFLRILSLVGGEHLNNCPPELAGQNGLRAVASEIDRLSKSCYFAAR